MPPRVTSTRRPARDVGVYRNTKGRGKKRAICEADEKAAREPSSSLTPPPAEPPAPKAKKSKKGDTRPCPVCLDDIPVRLLAQHSELELYRVDELLRAGVSSDFVESADAGPSSTRRGAALRARKSLNLHSRSDLDSLDHVDKTLKLLKRNRKQRHTKLKEIIAQDEDEDERPLADLRRGATCPVCLVQLGGDADVVDAHVDSCLANAQREQSAREHREALANLGEDVETWGEVEVDGEIRIRLNNVAGLRGTGIDIRDLAQADMEEDVDVDGDDAVFGDAQFTEGDVLMPTLASDDILVDVDVDGEGEPGSGGSLRSLVAQGKFVSRRQDADGSKAAMVDALEPAHSERLEGTYKEARHAGETDMLVDTLQKKIKYLESKRVSSSTSSLCRICLDPYDEPTVSTGCWHTCCRECWLRCLGSTKLCPICKRITGATELRRIYM